MSLETGTYISDLVSTNPTATDPVSQGDDHLRLIKATLLTTFPNIAGAVTPTHTELNFVDGVTSAIQTQLDTKHDAVGNGLQEDTPTTISVNAGAGIDVSGGDVALDISSLASINGNALASADGFLVDDGGVMSRMSYQNSGFRVVTVATTTETLTSADMNTVRRYTNASGCAVTLNSGIGIAGNWLVLIQEGAAAVTTAGTSTRNGAVGTGTEGTAYSAITLLCTAANTWVVLGDAG